MMSKFLKFKEGTSLSDHLNEFQGILDQMLGMGIKFEDEILGLLLLNSLPESWETFKGSILNEEMRRMRRKAQGSSSQSEDHDDDDDCVTTAIGDDLVILQDFESVNLIFDESMWIIDSGATLHVTLRKEFFTSYTSGNFGVLKMGNDGMTKTKMSFRKNPPSRKSELLELVHSDVCGPLKVKSFSGALYLVTFIYDCSKKLWVFTLKSKDQVLEKFKQFWALVERQSGKKVKCICSDNGGEYCEPFDVYYKHQGIRHEKTPPKTPQLNG
ncbi:hypothetical protein CR513_30489, partial [Mucuna pruriens]